MRQNGTEAWHSEPCLPRGSSAPEQRPVNRCSRIPTFVVIDQPVTTSEADDLKKELLHVNSRACMASNMSHIPMEDPRVGAVLQRHLAIDQGYD